MSDTHLCPRRVEVSPVFILPEHDTWVDGRCSYCGSMNPDAFMSGIADGTIELSPTTKNYKVYVKGPGCGSAIKFYFQHLSEEQKIEFIRLYNANEIRMSSRFLVPPFFCAVAEKPEL